MAIDAIAESIKEQTERKRAELAQKKERERLYGELDTAKKELKSQEFREKHHILTKITQKAPGAIKKFGGDAIKAVQGVGNAVAGEVKSTAKVIRHPYSRSTPQGRPAQTTSQIVGGQVDTKPQLEQTEVIRYEGTGRNKRKIIERFAPARQVPMQQPEQQTGRPMQPAARKPKWNFRPMTKLDLWGNIPTPKPKHMRQTIRRPMQQPMQMQRQVRQPQRAGPIFTPPKMPNVWEPVQMGPQQMPMRQPNQQMKSGRTKSSNERKKEPGTIRDLLRW